MATAAEELEARGNSPFVLRAFLQKLVTDYVAIVIASIALLAAVSSSMRSDDAIDDASEAKAAVNYELRALQNELEATRRSNELYTAYTAELRARMAAANISVPPLPE